MLKKSQRLSGRQFDEVIKRGRITHSPFFMVRILASGDQERSKLATVAPVRVAKTSVARHLLRRRIYEAARPLMERAVAGQHILLIAKQPAVGESPMRMRPEIESLFVKVGLLR